MLTSRSRIIAFMELKNSCLEENEIAGYFRDGDRDAILSWDDKLCNKVWNKLEIGILIRCEDFQEISDMYLCPFCLAHDLQLVSIAREDSCKNCEYGRNHGICFIEGSDYIRIVEELRESYNEESIGDFVFGGDETDAICSFALDLVIKGEKTW
jgi:hypothetical protein